MAFFRKTFGLAALLSALTAGATYAQTPTIPSPDYHISLQCEKKPVTLEEMIPGKKMRATIPAETACEITGTHADDVIDYNRLKLNMLPGVSSPTSTGYTPKQTANGMEFQIVYPEDYVFTIPITTEKNVREEERLLVHVIPKSATRAPETPQVPSDITIRKMLPAEAREEPKPGKPPVYALEVGWQGRNLSGSFGPDGSGAQIVTGNYMLRPSVMLRGDDWHTRLVGDLTIRTPKVNGELYTAVSPGLSVEWDTKDVDGEARLQVGHRSELIRAVTGNDEDLGLLEGRFVFGNDRKVKLAGSLYANANPVVRGFNAYAGFVWYPLEQVEAGVGINHMNFVNGDHFTSLQPELRLQVGKNARLGLVGMVGQTIGGKVEGALQVLPFLYVKGGAGWSQSTGAQSKVTDAFLYGAAALSNDSL